jgi:hypothetical protein
MVICLIVIASFVTFALDQTSSASTQQRETLAGLAQPAAGNERPPAQPAKHKSTFSRDVDELAGELTSPFSGIVSEASGEWADRSVKLLLALLVYGFGLGYLARALRVRV